MERKDMGIPKKKKMLKRKEKRIDRYVPVSPNIPVPVCGTQNMMGKMKMFREKNKRRTEKNRIYSMQKTEKEQRRYGWKKKEKAKRKARKEKEKKQIRKD